MTTTLAVRDRLTALKTEDPSLFGLKLFELERDLANADPADLTAEAADIATLVSTALAERVYDRATCDTSIHGSRRRLFWLTLVNARRESERGAASRAA